MREQPEALMVLGPWVSPQGTSKLPWKPLGQLRREVERHEGSRIPITRRGLQEA